MKFSLNKYNPYDWNKRFAFYPTFISESDGKDQYVWLEFYEEMVDLHKDNSPYGIVYERVKRRSLK